MALAPHVKSLGLIKSSTCLKLLCEKKIRVLIRAGSKTCRGLAWWIRSFSVDRLSGADAYFGIKLLTASSMTDF